ncbi:MAG: hypothetical protein ACYCX4_18165, partial [Bacillota bacterium]
MCDLKEDLLNITYSALDFNQGDLYSTSDDVISLPDKWLDLGYWLSIAQKVGNKSCYGTIERVFFVQNNPVIVFGRCLSLDDDIINKMFQYSWCMARPNFLFLAIPGELRVYNLNEAPVRVENGINIPKPLEIARTAAEVTEKLNV